MIAIKPFVVLKLSFRMVLFENQYNCSLPTSNLAFDLAAPTLLAEI
jgi:hypothetical protein